MTKNKARGQAYVKIKGLKECEVCKSKENLERHHADYNQPLKISVMCRSCHKDWYKKNKAIGVEGDNIKVFKAFLPEDLHQMLKIYSATTNEPMNDVIVDVLAKFIGRKKGVKFMKKFEPISEREAETSEALN